MVDTWCNFLLWPLGGAVALVLVKPTCIFRWNGCAGFCWTCCLLSKRNRQWNSRKRLNGIIWFNPFHFILFYFILIAQVLHKYINSKRFKFCICSSSPLPHSSSATLIPHPRENPLLTIWDISLGSFVCTYTHMYMHMYTYVFFSKHLCNSSFCTWRKAV